VTDRAGEVLVIGAGVAGLTSAVCLAESGLAVTVQARQLPRQTTSAVAGAIWGRHLVEDTDRVTRWCAETLEVLIALATDPGTGVRLITGIDVARAAYPRPGWAAPLSDLGPCDPVALPGGFTAGWRYTAPVVSMPVYLDYLASRLRSAGGQLTVAPLPSLAQAVEQSTAPVIVNCTGAEARDFVPDPSVNAVRGQVVVAENPGLTEFFIGGGDETYELSYVFPHQDRVVLGGTENPGDWSLDPRPATAQRILADCAAIDSRLATARILEHLVGLRPVRRVVRLEAEAADGERREAGRLVVHNYGHGGAGVTLSWGCAREVARLVESAR
jgi:D-amino-acid oxidase